LSRARPSGYETDDEFFATRSTQGSRVVYSVELSPLLIATGLVARPDPDRPTEGNRVVRLGHAQNFAQYFRKNNEWVSPALMLRAPDVFTFTAQERVGDVQFGVLSIAKLDRGELRILDGQHRILGFYLAYETLTAERVKARELLVAAERNGDEPAVIAHFKAQLDKLNAELRRMTTEHIAAQIHVTNDPKLFKQMFVDVADNALGIKKSIQAGFDSRKVVHRALPLIVQHPLLEGRVDEQQDTISRKSPYLLGLKHVADIVRTLAVGLRGRFTAERERSFTEQQLVDLTVPFLDALRTSFEDLGDLASGNVTPVEVRETSLLGSATILRVLAGVWYVLHESGYDFTDAQVAAFFENLNPIMIAPLPDDSPWLQDGREGDFYRSAKGQATSPNAHRGVDLHLADALVGWACQPPVWLCIAEGASEDSVSEDSVSEDSVSEDSVSEDSVPVADPLYGFRFYEVAPNLWKAIAGQEAAEITIYLPEAATRWTVSIAPRERQDLVDYLRRNNESYQRSHPGESLPVGHFDYGDRQMHFEDFADREAAMRHAAHWLMASAEGAEFLRTSLAEGFSD
jgi:hypothetical protein